MTDIITLSTADSRGEEIRLIARTSDYYVDGLTLCRDMMEKLL